ncbi:hypothetical protein DEO72_LG3g420 [Vigna unguiculata]|uniref:Uncharacterized protein n=1 Tax=Vigna unguiculata TaxID=3917 RepID=A0A4D6LBI5_VIGUN|nr:hypothetical protein DEO72_LG3g420 [Vigna unguiculata]
MVTSASAPGGKLRAAKRYTPSANSRDFIALHHIGTRPYGFLQYNDSIHQSFGGTTFFPDQNHSKTHRTPKSSQFHSRRLAGIHHRQTVHRKTQELGCRFMAPGGTGIHCQAVPQGT